MTISVKAELGVGKKITATTGGFSIETDMGPACGGEGTAPEPFDLFFASLTSCAALYARNFCEARDISIEGLILELKVEKNDDKGLWDQLTFELTLPTHFPEKYRNAIIKAMDACTVKKHIVNPLHFTTNSIN